MMRKAIAVAVLTCVIGACPVLGDAITVGKATQTAVRKVDGKGTWSIDPGRTLVKIEMVVVTQPGGMEVSRTIGIVPMGTTEWGSISTGPLTVGQLYYVRAEITSKDNMGIEKKTNSMNYIPITIQNNP